MDNNPPALATDHAHEYMFSEQELKKLANYRAAVKNKFYNDDQNVQPIYTEAGTEE